MNETIFTAIRESIFIAIIVMVLIAGVCFWEKASCHKKAVSFEKSEYTPLGGCMVKHNGKWLPLDNIRGFDDKG